MADIDKVLTNFVTEDISKVLPEFIIDNENFKPLVYKENNINLVIESIAKYFNITNEDLTMKTSDFIKKYGKKQVSSFKEKKYITAYILMEKCNIFYNYVKHVLGFPKSSTFLITIREENERIEKDEKIQKIVEDIISEIKEMIKLHS